MLPCRWNVLFNSGVSRTTWKNPNNSLCQISSFNLLNYIRLHVQSYDLFHRLNISLFGQKVKLKSLNTSSLHILLKHDFIISASINGKISKILYHSRKSPNVFYVAFIPCMNTFLVFFISSIWYFQFICQVQMFSFYPLLIVVKSY